MKKNQALIDEIKQREQSTGNRTLMTFKLDPACELKNVHVLDDYTCYMQQTDIAYNERNEQTRFYKMQLLQRNDEKKWFVWFQTGKVGSEDNAGTRINEFFNKYDAMVEFEQKFSEKTANKWKDRDYFQQKPGKFILMKKEQDKELVQKHLD